MGAEARNIQQQFTPLQHDVIVIGTGPVGMRFVTQFARVNTTSRIAIFGDEPWLPYNRVNLTALLTGDIREDKLYVSFDAAKHANVSCYYNNRIVQVDRQSREVIDSQGVRHGYGTLVLATGSSPFMPNIPGTQLNNVFSFRDLSDAQKLMGRIVRSRHTVVIGGGLLGLEAARAMHRFNTNVTVIEHSMWLMFRQLDQRAGSYLKRHIETLGIHVRTSERVLEIIGSDKVQGVLLGSGETIECDTVVVAAGIVPNLQLIRKSGLYFSKGIRVNDQMQTSDPNIYAIGECAEHRKKIYGLVTPGYEQADVLAYNLNGGRAEYVGSTATTSLRVLDYPVFSMGEVDLPTRSHEEIRFQDHQKGIYRRLFILHGRLRGVVAIGGWSGIERLQEMVARQRRIWPWQVSKFKKTGILWADEEACNVVSWPGQAVVCRCTGTTRANLV
ncbi:MAG TPA: FAD-dependent oxidoreductase, partial [Gammaproteobacteria bacterium]|nr:FAD-dependent oxidoreductase [Gammaproteobacteria bacterium]